MITSGSLEEALSPKQEGAELDFFGGYIEEYGYYDLFLIHSGGQVFYSVTHEDEYRTNIIDGKYKDSGLGKLVSKVLKTKQYGIADVEPYAPSNGDPAAFIALPMVDDGEVEMVLALQLPLEAINAVMTQRGGQGEIGETYLVGSDKLMRSDSYLDRTNHSVKASFADPSKGSVDTEATRRALAGETGAQIIIDYNGTSVLSAFSPLKVRDMTWAPVAEAFAAVATLQGLMGIVATVALLAIFAITWLVARAIVRPPMLPVAVRKSAQPVKNCPRARRNKRPRWKKSLPPWNRWRLISARAPIMPDRPNRLRRRPPPMHKRVVRLSLRRFRR